MIQEIFGRAELLLGTEAMERVAEKRVIVFGVGGVGSWCAESLVRSGFRKVTIVDADRVSITNVNRQLMATMDTVGRVKVEALRERLLSIHPEAEITALEKTFTEQTASEFQIDSYDYVIDAIDSLKDKAQLLLTASACENTKLFSSMGAALKLDPTRIKVAEFWKVEGDPLARALRKKFKHMGRFPQQKFMCVFSDELLPNLGASTNEEEPGMFQKAQTNGSLVHITAIFGFTLAGLVLEDVVKEGQG